ncbi:protein cornichon homolog 4-like [Mangifera indica]|uniref:protein cornichon homolog 4-like n=1 Tax=Mangifera indica TaxID=29780 RepID=UPI001CF973F9|nr:protein cornichon homolog 4-like [Mangifera indica]XP_044501198.1 protein cornichon homolog 4-like [Mangifera indica]XP_044501200.1 protein cornichon homolog 4-like [Mangifera indica]
MGDLFGWLLVFTFLISLLAILSYQLMCLTGLEVDYINPYDSAAQINMLVFPEFATHGILCIIYLMTGHWFMFLLSLPYLHYNMGLYRRGQHLVDVTEIYSQLNGEKKQRLFKLGYLIILLVLCIFWLLWTVGEQHD